MSATKEQLKEAYDLGKIAAENAASWIVDGNTDRAQIAIQLKRMEDGDPQADDFLPAYPNLSGEWAGDPTPLSLAREITGEGPRYTVSGDRERTAEDVSEGTIGELADSWEAGVSDHFTEACERELRAALGIPETMTFGDWEVSR